MGKIAWVYPGQGSQYVGMGKELCEQHDEARTTFEQAEQTLGANLRQIVFEGPDESLKQTDQAQPAIFVLSVALSRVLSSMGGAPDMVAGHSVGEYSALVAAGAMKFEDALLLVRDRAVSMQEACEKNPGMMLAVLGIDAEKVQDICSEIADGIVDVANINSPGQIIISGEIQAVRAAGEAAVERGARKTIPLNVAGAFHSRLMRSAAEKYESSVMSATISSPVIDFFPNVSASLTGDPEQIRSGLVEQVYSPVRWQLSVERMLEGGAETFVEVGPGRVLTGLLKRIRSSAVGLNVDKPESLEAVAQSR